MQKGEKDGGHWCYQGAAFGGGEPKSLGAPRRVWVRV